MRRFLENKVAYAATASLFTMALAWNVVHGNGALASGSHLIATEPVMIAHGPSMPPDPWEGIRTAGIAHGPSMPPDPWEGVRTASVTHGPSMPPDPWEGVA